MDVLAFDAYGTLFDVYSVTERCEKLYPGHGNDISQIWRQRQLQYTLLHSMMNDYIDFESITRNALAYAVKSLRLTHTKKNEDELFREYLNLKPFPEVPEALRSLRPRKLAILSNGTVSMLKKLVSNTKLENYFDAILSVDPLRVYKPSPKVYQLVLTKFKAGKNKTLFVSSNSWDSIGAKNFGLPVVWVNRGNAAPEELGLNVDYQIPDLSGLPEIASK